MDEHEIYAMLVAARKEAWAAARARRAPQASAMAVAAMERRSAKTEQERAAQRLQAAWRGRQAWNAAMRRRDVLACATARGNRVLCRHVLMQWRMASAAAVARRAVRRQFKAAKKERRRAAIRLQAAWRGTRGRREATGRRQRRLALLHARIEAALQPQREVYEARVREEDEWRAAAGETRRVLAEAELRRAAAALLRRRTARQARAATAREQMAKRAIAAAAALSRQVRAAADEERRLACVRVQAAARRRIAADAVAARGRAITEQRAKERQAAERRIGALVEEAEEPMWLQEAGERLMLGGEGRHEAATWRAEAARWMERVEARLAAVHTPLAELPWPRRSGGRQRRMTRLRRRGDCWAIDCEMAEQRAEARAEQRFMQAAAARSITVSK